MPHFYFDTKNEEELSDDDCFEFASTDEAMTHAIRYLAEAAADHVSHLAPTITCTVRDERKRPLVRLRLSLEIAKEDAATARAMASKNSPVMELYSANAHDTPPGSRSDKGPSIDK